EPIEALVLEPWGEEIWGLHAQDERLKASREIGGKVVSWEQARPFLDYEYDSGFGGQDCHSVTIWTPTRVIFVHEYDGATGLTWVPRHPVEHCPAANGLGGLC